MFLFLFLLAPADHAQPHARVSECTLHLWVGVQAPLPLHALGTLHSCLLSTWVGEKKKLAQQKFHVAMLPFPVCLWYILHVYVFPSQEANTSLVRACWNELFILGLAQCAHVMNLSTILTAIINHLQSSVQDGMDQRPRHHLTVGHKHENRSKEMSFLLACSCCCLH